MKLITSFLLISIIVYSLIHVSYGKHQYKSKIHQVKHRSRSYIPHNNHKHGTAHKYYNHYYMEYYRRHTTEEPSTKATQKPTTERIFTTHKLTGKPKTTRNPTTSRQKTTRKPTTVRPKTTRTPTMNRPKTTRKPTTARPKTTRKLTTARSKTTRKLTTARSKTTRKLTTARPKTTRKLTTARSKTTRTKRTTQMPCYTYECKHQREEAKKIREMYQMVSEITPNLFALTLAESKNFTNLFNREKVETPGFQCNRGQLPKYADCKIMEVQEILKNSSCSPTTRQPPAADIQNDNEPVPIEAHKRTRRAAKGDRIINPDGSITTIRDCFDRGSTTENRNLLLCRLCTATTELQENRFPRYLNEILCDDSNLEHRRCLSGEGYCYQNFYITAFRFDANNVGRDRLAEWTTYQQRTNTFCSCQALPSSLFIAPIVP